MLTAGGGGAIVAPNVADVYSTDTYTGNGNYSPKSGVNTITNGVDLSSEGGLVWAKARSSATSYFHALFDTERGVSATFRTDSTGASSTFSGYGVTSFNSNGFTLEGNLYGENQNGASCVAWTFRKAQAFFDIVTYTGDGTNPRDISHNLGCQAGMVIVKRIDSSNNWNVWHRKAASYGQTDGYYQGRMESDVEFGYSTVTGASASTFTVNADTGVNANGGSYIAYIFAHNGEDDDIVRCGVYTGNGSSSGPSVDVGFRPQWVMIKRTDAAADWVIMDTARGIVTGGNEKILRPNSATQEVQDNYIKLTTSGFDLEGTSSRVNASGGSYIYVAIKEE